MKKILLLLSLSFVYMHSQTQNLPADSWKIIWNKKVLLATSKSDETGNIGKIVSGDLDKNYVLEISYKEADSKKLKEWNRSFIFMDAGDNELLRKDSTRNTRISATDLKKLFDDRKEIKI